MRVVRDVWLSDVLERPVFNVLDLDAKRSPTTTADDALECPGAFYFAKVPSTDIGRVDALSARGFSVIEASVTFARSAHAGLSDAQTPTLQVRPAIEQWREHVLQIAGSAFRYSRFHLDPAFDRREADRVKREWIRSYFDGHRGDQLLVAMEGDEPVGFLAFLLASRDDRRVGVIDLMAVRPDCQGRGIGKRLIEAALDECRGKADVLEVGTQTANLPSIRLYEETGFKMVRAGFVLHHHVPRSV